MLQLPLASACVVPLEVVPSKSVTVLLASAVPAKVMLPSVSKLLLAGLLITGALGAVTSLTCNVKLALLL